MDIPDPSGNPEQDFPLCFACHNSEWVLGVDTWDVSHTNLWSDPDDGDPLNGHKRHLYFGYDSDWDGAGNDSSGSCVSCHNVHGAPNGPMVRHGELISTYGTTDKVPSLDFGYVTSSSDPNIDPDATLMDSIAGRMGGFTGVCRT